MKKKTIIVGIISIVSFFGLIGGTILVLRLIDAPTQHDDAAPQSETQTAQPDNAPSQMEARARELVQSDPDAAVDAFNEAEAAYEAAGDSDKAIEMRVNADSIRPTETQQEPAEQPAVDVSAGN